MSQDTVQRVGASRHDDLTCIAGIGPEILSRLNEAGIRTHAELGDCSAVKGVTRRLSAPLGYRQLTS